MINLNYKQIEKALPKVKQDLAKYLWIQNNVYSRNIYKDKEFQRKFNVFYGITPFRNEEWQKIFYKLFETNKNQRVDFRDILNKFYKKTGRIEASFISKFVATINPKLPIIDSVVLKNLKLKLPYTRTENRITKTVKIYLILTQSFTMFIKTKNGKYLIKRFIEEYPNADITKVKMIDLILWQTR